MLRKPYPSYLRDKQWDVLKPLIPAAKAGVSPRTVDVREIINAIFYILAVRLCSADAASRPPTLVNGLLLLPSVAKGKGLATV